MLTRFAPAPTGWLHLGHVLNAEYVWSAGARVLLRIEDHDRQRCRPEYEVGLLEDLDWLGYRADFPPVRQSERGAIYQAAAEVLSAQGLVYACDCTRKQLQPAARAGGGARTASAAAATAEAELRYRGRCRDRGVPLVDGCGWRLRMDRGVERFVDERLGPQAQDPAAQCGDVLIRDRRGNWTYQFAVSVDDLDQRIDLVIRGEDLLRSTGRQMRIARLLGRPAPARFLHHPLIMKSGGQKLSKSDGATGIRELRASGWTPAQVKTAARAAVQRSTSGRPP